MLLGISPELFFSHMTQQRHGEHGTQHFVGEVVCWGNRLCGGEMGVDGLGKVKQISASHTAFAAILTDGSVVTWGDPRLRNQSEFGLNGGGGVEVPYESEGARDPL